MYRIVLD